MLVQYDDDVLVQYDDEPIPGVLIAAEYVAWRDEGDGMVEEEGAQGSRGYHKRRRGSGTGRGGSRSKKEKGTPDAGQGGTICPKCARGCSSKCRCKCHS